MLSQYTADTLIVEQRILSTPSCIQSIPAAADQEDFVCMGMNGALKTRQILDNANGVLGIELIAAAQALDFRDFTPGKGIAPPQAAVRKVVAHLDEDRPLFPDHNAMAAPVGLGRGPRGRRGGRRPAGVGRAPPLGGPLGGPARRPARAPAARGLRERRGRHKLLHHYYADGLLQKGGASGVGDSGPTTHAGLRRRAERVLVANACGRAGVRSVVSCACHPKAAPVGAAERGVDNECSTSSGAAQVSATPCPVVDRGPVRDRHSGAAGRVRQQ